MVDSIKPNFRPVPPVGPTERVKASAQPETHNDDKAGEDYIVTVDRRKGRDRRKGKDQRPIYDMRSGKGRRKNDPGASIEIKI